MTESATAFSTARDADAGHDLARQINEKLNGEPPDALIVFASPSNDLRALLGALRAHCPGGELVGCTSAGEFTSAGRSEGATSAVALRSDELRFSTVLAREVHVSPAATADTIVAAFSQERGSRFRHRAALVLTDALAGLADELVTELTTRTAGRYQFFGGGAGDDARFSRTMVFRGEEIASDAVVALEILSEKPIGVGVRHGWEPASAPLRVTEAHGTTIVSLNAAPAVEAFEEHAEAIGQRFDREEPLPFFLHNVLGVGGAGGYKLRVPLALLEDGSVQCATEVPEGATVHFMRATTAASAEATSAATLDALQQLNGHKPEVALFFDCVASRLRMGQEFDVELGALQRRLGDAAFVGFNTYGQVARADGQFSGFHNCTAVVCIIPE